jgi:prephenate dehydrogenase
MKLFQRIAIIGTGLVGGSIALAVKRKRIAGEVIGVSRHKETIRLALKNRAIDRGSQDLGIIKGADLVIFATPVGTIIDQAAAVSRVVGPDCIVSDVGSTKFEITSCLEKIFPNFVGSHPLAGSERRGFIWASSGLFESSLCIITPTRKTNSGALKKITGLWKRLGADVIRMDPALHDRILAQVSHLPHLLAYSLINSSPREYLRFAAGSLRDTTRVAASDSRLWTDIFLSNRENLLFAVEAWQKELAKIKSAIAGKNAVALDKLLRSAKQKRESLR